MTLTNEQIIQIRELQAAGIQHKALTQAQLDMIYTNNWFNLWVPQDLHGLETSFPQGLAVLEELAYWDGGLGWTVTLCSGANMFAGFIDPELAKQVWTDPKVCLGGSGQVGGKAVRKEDGYEISGLWSYATGAPHLTHFTLNAEIYEAGQQVFQPDGEPLIRSFFVPRDQVLVHYDWDTFGLECTASHSFSLDQVWVPASFAFQLDPSHKQSTSPLFEIPFMPFAELTLLVNYMGMFRRFTDLVEKYYFEKSTDWKWADLHSKSRFKELDEIQVKHAASRKDILQLAALLWTQANASKPAIDSSLLNEIAQKSRAIVSDIRNDTAALFPHQGIRAAQRTSELNIVVRNLFTATQHSLLR